MTRLPIGYVGRDHETLGSDILSIYGSLKSPEQVFGADEAKKIAAVNPNAWYPIAWQLELLEIIDARVGHFGLLSLGRTLFKTTHAPYAKGILHNASDVLYGLDEMYRHANRGHEIGGWKVMRFEPGRAEVEKNTPHHCLMEQGILDEALRMVNAPSLISQAECFRHGAPLCRFIITSTVTDVRWGAKRLRP